MAMKCCQTANNGNLNMLLNAAALMTAAKAEQNESLLAACGSEAEGASSKPPQCAIVMQCVVSLAGERGVGPRRSCAAEGR